MMLWCSDDFVFLLRQLKAQNEGVHQTVLLCCAGLRFRPVLLEIDRSVEETGEVDAVVRFVNDDTGLGFVRFCATNALRPFVVA